MQKTLLLLALLTAAITASAQKITVKGRVFDSSENKGLPYATASLVKAQDSTLVTFARADSAGNFKLNNIERGNYLLSTSFVGYGPVWFPLPVLNAQQVYDAGNVYMTNI